MPINSHAHDTTHIHPLITAKIGELIKKKDLTDSYSEIYVADPNPKDGIDPAIQLLYWGTDFDAGKDPNLLTPDWLLDNQPAAFHQPLNVINGVVQEDIPDSKVKNHFYHATTGTGLLTTSSILNATINSRVVAMGFFEQAIEYFGMYDESAKKIAFFTFGQSLHHVEDGTSPAHIHNDIHITNSDSEKDDYEGYFLPMQRVGDGAPVLAGLDAATPAQVDNPRLDIWGEDNPNSMVRITHAKTTFQGTLQYPVADYEVVSIYVGLSIVDLGVVPNNPVTPPPDDLPTGEMEQMFPCKDVDGNRDTAVDFCLHWQNEPLDVLAHWTINEIGDYIHQFTPSTSINPDSWWPVDGEISDIGEIPVPSGSTNLVPFTDGYYIEQLAVGNDRSNPLVGQVIPATIRADLGGVEGEANTKPLMEIYAQNLLGHAVKFGAGFTQYWYDVANTPPYLKEVTVKQKPSANENEQIVYRAKWVVEGDNLIDEWITYARSDLCHPVMWGLLEYNSCPDDEEYFFSENARELRIANEEVINGQTLDTSIKHVAAEQNLLVKLTFNEPIKQIDQLRLGDFSESGACISPSNCADITPPVDQDGNLISPYDKANIEEEVTGDDGRKNRVWHWEITVDKSKLSNLHGQLKLTVKAIDKNNHRDGQGGVTGGELDGTPNTPARRDTTRPEENYYPWYSKDDQFTTTFDSFAYSYDFENGDQNHYLVFDTTAPTVTVDVQTTLPAPMTLP